MEQPQRHPRPSATPGGGQGASGLTAWQLALDRRPWGRGGLCPSFPSCPVQLSNWFNLAQPRAGEKGPPCREPSAPAGPPTPAGPSSPRFCSGLCLGRAGQARKQSPPQPEVCGAGGLIKATPSTPVPTQIFKGSSNFNFFYLNLPEKQVLPAVFSSRGQAWAGRGGEPRVGAPSWLELLSSVGIEEQPVPLNLGVPALQDFGATVPGVGICWRNASGPEAGSSPPSAGGCLHLPNVAGLVRQPLGATGASGGQRRGDGTECHHPALGHTTFHVQSEGLVRAGA